MAIGLLHQMHKPVMNPDSICIATISKAKSEAEERLMRSSLTQLAAYNLPVVITDGGSSPSLLHFMRSLPQTTVLRATAPGLLAQVQSSISAAFETGKPFILYTEPDKEIFFRNSLPNFLNEVKEGENLGVAMAARSLKAFDTFPAFQKLTETTINQCCAEVLGLKADYCYGPFVFHRRLAPFVCDVKENIGWGWRPFAFGLSHRLGYALQVVKGENSCPTDQRNDDANERLYRMTQLEQNIRGLLLSTTVLI